MPMMVELGERRYPIHIEPGGLGGLGAAVVDALGPTPRAIVVSNPVVAPLYGAAVVASLQSVGIESVCLEVPDGEHHKTLATWQQLTDALLSQGIDRKTPIVALGGGVTGDIAGFAAATVMRGVPWVQVPTTLLAMVDSSVGGKTGVNTASGKNLIGAFHQPSLVFAAMDTLQSLPSEEIRCGLGEVVKHAVLADNALMRRCAQDAGLILQRDGEVLADLVARSCAVKARIVAQDEREAGLRAVLNLGHTAGHALETVLAGGPQALPHGVCVAIGLVAEARWAARRGDCAKDVPQRIAEVLDGMGLPTHAPPVDLDELVAAARFDKKVHRGRLQTAIIEAVGRVRLAEVDVAEIPHLFHSISGHQ